MEKDMQSQKTNDKPGKIFATYIPDKELISAVHKSLLKVEKEMF